MDDDDYKSIILSWDQEVYVSDYADPEDFTNEISGKVFAEGEDENRELAGNFKIYYVDVSRAMDNGISAFDVFDSHSQGLYDHYCELFNGDEFNEKLQKHFNDDIYGSNLLILDRLEIVPKYRGKNWGLKVLRELIDRFSSGAGIVAIKPYPLQHELIDDSPEKQKWFENMELSKLTQDKNTGIKKLTEHYGKLGFQHVEDIEYMVLSTCLKMPSIADK
jgi:GNAT superfamily N-acetyltransferase